MCGIVGLFNSSDTSIVNSMLHSIGHRGPDDIGVHTGDKFSCGMVRLSITDTSKLGHQPMVSKCSGVVLVFNGEIYNYLELRDNLKQFGYQFKSNSDTEVVLNLFLQFDVKAFSMLNGMFSIGIFDSRKGANKLLLVRDPLGIKPLFFSYKNGVLVFGSEIKSILASGLIVKEFNKGALIDFFKYGSFQQPSTVLNDVSMLDNGQYLIVEKNAISYHKFSQLTEEPSGFNEYAKIKSHNERVEVLDHLLIESVRKQMPRDVSYGAFLSGGVDSSLLVGIMSNKLSTKFNTYSIGFESTSDVNDETKEAQNIANYYGTSHSEEIVNAEDASKSFFDFIKSIDQPSIDGINSFFVSRLASKDVKVCISGTGADELFGGYPWFPRQLDFFNQKQNYKQKLLSSILSYPYFNSLSIKERGLIPGLINKYRPISSFNSYFARNHYVFNSQQLGKLISSQFISKSYIGQDLSHAYDKFDIIQTSSVLTRVTKLSLQGYLRNQLLRDIDATSMFHSLEVRVPYLDNEIVRFSLAIPDDSKVDPIKSIVNVNGSYSDSGVKKILIDLGKKYLPKGFQNQPKKGFSLPIENWLKTTMHSYVQDVFESESLNNRGIFNANELKILYKNYLNGSVAWTQIWLILIFEFWCRENID